MAIEQTIVPRHLSNALCRKCVRPCRQPAAAVLIDCPRFQPLPFKVEEPRYSQLDLFSGNQKSS